MLENAKYIHYTENKFKLDHQRVYEQPFDAKPRGLWVSVETPDGSENINWKQWCKSEEFDVHRLQTASEVRLSPNNNVLFLKDVKAFDSQYRLGRDNPYVLNWTRVAERYDGIVIAPHSWTLRRECLWYSPWDCASGCIWNLDVIDEVKEK